MKIWGRANSINVMKVLWAADECGITYERTDVGGAFGGNEPWYLKMNPNGVVPTIDDGGRVIWESNSAVRYLAAKYAAGTLWPTDPGQRSEADRWMDWQLSTLSECMRVVFWGLVRTPTEKRDMAAIKKAAEDMTAVQPPRCAPGRPALCRGPAFHHGRHPGHCFAYRWRPGGISARRQTWSLVRSADASGLRQAHHGEADLTPSGGAGRRQQAVDRQRDRVGPASRLVGSMPLRLRSIGFCWASSTPCPRRTPFR
jgi:glutathione S-transferase